ncbi:hypothetical protein [Streptomyces katsurahamanus]|uniref:Uncharacterized protein n=1 Tax=Streptomyces katsurahamanus TaxID=2577098 RepID=A0ABW9NYX8_9ACTN|nr:hypothetical protein [Streptomyces katsurahamanus]MQS38502.1 hypothetical protein [Streptomyces katsurahamanus]
MDRSLLSLRATLVLLLSALAGVTAGVLSTLAGDGAARSVLAGLAAAGLAVPFFDRLVAGDRPRGRAGAEDGDARG